MSRTNEELAALEATVRSIVDSNIAMAVDQNENVDNYIDNIGDTLKEKGLATDDYAQHVAVERILALLVEHNLTSDIYRNA